MPIVNLTACTNCNGTGDIEDGLCPICLGTGNLPVRGIAMQIKLLTDTIIAEQASQREDLTTILTLIWNKVKTL